MKEGRKEGMKEGKKEGRRKEGRTLIFTVFFNLCCEPVTDFSSITIITAHQYFTIR